MRDELADIETCELCYGPAESLLVIQYRAKKTLICDECHVELMAEPQGCVE